MSAGSAAGGTLIAEGAHVSPSARIGEGTEIQHGAVVHDGVSLGAGCLVESGAVLGKRPRLRAGSSAAGRELGQLVLGDGVTVCSGAVVYVGAVIGPRVIIGDQVQIREGVRIGAGSVVGRGSSVDFDAQLGERVLIQTGVYITGGSLVEDDVFVGPGVVTTNDDTMGRHGPDEPLQGPILRRACRVGGGAVLVPGVEIGEEAFIAAGAVVTRNVLPRAVMIGTPARHVRDVGEDDLFARWHGSP